MPWCHINTSSFQAHFKEKASGPKFALNGIWKSVISSNLVPAAAKTRIFNSVMRAILCYASPVWGFDEYVIVERLLRLFVKKLYFLPSYNPCYMIHLETGLDPIICYNLGLHFKYVRF